MLVVEIWQAPVFFAVLHIANTVTKPPGRNKAHNGTILSKFMKQQAQCEPKGACCLKYTLEIRTPGAHDSLHLPGPLAFQRPFIRVLP
jgi:hypothetical protein